MGLQYSVFNIIGDATAGETTTEERREDGTVAKVTIRRKNPWISGTAILAATTLLVVYIDGGKGMVSKSFGKACVSCEKSIN